MTAERMTDSELIQEIEETQLFDVDRLLELYREVFKRWKTVQDYIKTRSKNGTSIPSL